MPSPAVLGETSSAVGLLSMICFMLVAAFCADIGHCEARLHSLKAKTYAGACRPDSAACESELVQ